MACRRGWCYRAQRYALGDVDERFGQWEHQVCSIIGLHDLAVHTAFDLESFAPSGNASAATIQGPKLPEWSKFFLGLIDGREMVPLAVTTKERVAKFANVPTIAESGYPDYTSAAWYGFAVPKGTPRPVIDKLRTATLAALAMPAVKERLESEGSTIVGDQPAEFAAMMKGESARWASFLGQAGISIDWGDAQPAQLPAIPNRKTDGAQH
jgi:hypothetical protein